MKTNLILLSVIILAAALWTVVSSEQQHPINGQKTLENVQENKLTDFTYTTLTGVRSSLRAHQGKIVLLHFWATWCAPCLIEFPALMELAGVHQDDLVVLAVTTDGRKTDIERFLKKLTGGVPANVHIIQDDERKTISETLYQTYKLPETYVITPSLSLHEKIVGPEDNWNSRPWHEKIQKLVRE